MEQRRTLHSFRPQLRKLARGAAWGAVALQVGAVIAVHAVDSVRKSRIPGGSRDFPTLPPADIPVEDSVVRVYTEGTSLYSDMLEAIRSAKDHVFFETYIIRADHVGQIFKRELIAAARRGVEVFFTYDGFGTLNQPQWFKRFPQIPTLHVHRLAELRTGLLTGNLRQTGRNHRKLLVVDDEVAFVGGFNIGDNFGHEWRDTHVRVMGPAVRELSDGFAEFWNTFRSRREPKLHVKYQREWAPAIQPAFNLPSRLLFPVRGLYLDAFERARRQILITTAYFIPDREIMSSLVGAAKRGVKVKVLIPEYSNHILADWAGWPFLGELLRNGVEIWLYQHAMVHAKTMTVDGMWSTVGTANVDRLSLQGNFEVNLQIESTEFAAQMEKIFAKDLTTARPLSYEEWANRGALVEFGEWLLRPIGSLL